MIKKNLTSSIILVMMLLITPCVSAQTYRQIKGWSKEVNDRLEDFLNSTITVYACYHSSYRNKFYPEMNQLFANLKEYGFEVWILTASPEFLNQKFLAEQLGIPEVNILGVKSVVVGGKLTDDIILPIPLDDAKANVIPTFIKTRPLVVGGNSRGDMDMLNQSCGLKIVVNPDDKTVRGKEDGPMNGYTVKGYWEKEGALIVKCHDVREPGLRFHTEEWGIRENVSNPKE